MPECTVSDISARTLEYLPTENNEDTNDFVLTSLNGFRKAAGTFPLEYQTNYVRAP